MISHISSECYPVAKVGGLADVVGALPTYLNKKGAYAHVIMPFYENAYTQTHPLEVVHQGVIPFGPNQLPFTVLQNTSLGFDVFLIQVSEVFDREQVYGYEDDAYRQVIFQLAVLFWMNTWEIHPSVIHCHDHQTGLIPFLLTHAYAFESMKYIPTVFTIHNGEYQGFLPDDIVAFLPWYPKEDTYKMQWDNTFNSLACGIRNAWRVTTVSPQYLREMQTSSQSVFKLLNYESGKCVGILNGIDVTHWNPQKDSYLSHHYDIENVEKGKRVNKKELCKTLGLEEDRPLISFIGRFAHEKGADVLGDFIWNAIQDENLSFNFLVMGSGNYHIEKGLEQLRLFTNNRFNYYFAYDEPFAHLVYAGSDFMLMPSRVEPCGLNQMYAMKYGTIPIVRTVGGLLDTVVDFEDEGGFGVRFVHNTVPDVLHAFLRAQYLYHHPNKWEMVREMMKIDHSWEHSIENYISLYNSIT